MKTALIVTAALAVAACATSAGAEYRPEQTTFEGYLNFSGEEFQLIDSQNRYASGRQRPCVSGALPRDGQREAATDIGAQKVRITGTTMAWSRDLPGNRFTYEGSNIRNECGGSFVILATDIAPIP